MNSVNLTGRLTADPIVRTTKGDTTVCDMRLAVQRRRSREGDDRGAVFIDITAFGALASNCGEYLTKGRQIAITGRLELDEWQAESGETRRKHKIVAEQVEFLDCKSTESEPAGETSDSADV